MPKTYTVEVISWVEVTVNDPDVVERVTSPEGDTWRSQLYDLHTEDDVVRHLAYNCAINGCENATALDGWADLPPAAVSMRLIATTGTVEHRDDD